jgi:hypothetical protein
MIFDFGCGARSSAAPQTNMGKNMGVTKFEITVLGVPKLQ